jgi:hypothetical protein
MEAVEGGGGVEGDKVEEVGGKVAEETRWIEF